MASDCIELEIHLVPHEKRRLELSTALAAQLDRAAQQLVLRTSFHLLEADAALLAMLRLRLAAPLWVRAAHLAPLIAFMLSWQLELGALACLASALLIFAALFWRSLMIARVELQRRVLVIYAFHELPQEHVRAALVRIMEAHGFLHDLHIRFISHSTAS